MKKQSLLATTIAIVAIAGLATAIGALQLETSGKPIDHFSYGAVKTNLYERMEGDPPNGPGSGDLAGFAIINVDPCTEMLMVNTKLAAGEGDTIYDVYVKTNGAVQLVGTLMTNPVGRGTAQFYLDASAYAGEEGPGAIEVQVVVKPEGTSAIIGFATDTIVENFPDCDEDGETWSE